MATAEPVEVSPDGGVAPVLLAELHGGISGIRDATALLGGDLASQVAWFYLGLQVVSAGAVSLLGPGLLALAGRLSPPDPAETLGRPRYLYEQALGEAESALDLVEKEQARLVKRLPRMLDALRPD